MGGVGRRVRTVDVLSRVALAAVLLAAVAPSTAVAAPAVKLTARADKGARLGQPSSIRASLHVNTRTLRSPVRHVSLRYPAGFAVETSGLGAAPCRRHRDDFTDVILEGIQDEAICPANSLMATGTVRGMVLADGERLTAEVGSIDLHAGPLERGRLGIVAVVTGWNPLGATLVFGGRIEPARGRYGGALSIDIKPPPVEWGASLAVTDFDITIGGRDIVYTDQGVRYRPDGIALPARCPRSGFGFSVRLNFADGRRRDVASRMACPRR